MAILSRKKEETVSEVEQTGSTPKAEMLAVGHQGFLATERISEKSSQLRTLNKHVFLIRGSVNKAQLKRVLEKQYGVRIATVNVINGVTRTKRRGKSVTGGTLYKKAVVTLVPGSKSLTGVVFSK